MTGPTDGVTGPPPAGSPVEDYLDRLLVVLPGPPREVRHLLAEAEGHLRDATDTGIAAGLTPLDAEVEAVRRFGPSAALAAGERRRQAPSISALIRQGVWSAWLLGSLGAIAVGISGVLAGMLRAFGGSRFIIDVTQHAPPLSAANCARWLSLDPAAHTCAQAAINDWANETVWYRIFLGVLGLMALGVWFAVRRSRRIAGRLATLPTPVIDTIALTMFAASGVWLLGLGVDALTVSSGHGAGQWLSAAPVSLGLAVVFGIRLLGDLRQVPPAVTDG